MNDKRNLIWGIALSLLAHGALLGLPISHEGRRNILPHHPTPLEISLVRMMAHEDFSPKEMSVPVTRPQGAGENIKAKGKRSSKENAPSTRIARPVENVRVVKNRIQKRRKKPIPVPNRKPGPPARYHNVLTPELEPSFEALQARITESTGWENPVDGKLPLLSPTPSAKNLVGERPLKARLIPKEERPSPSPTVTLALPRYDRNPKPHYPRMARRKGYEGIVVLKAEILPTGRVGQLWVERSSGHPILDRSALKTVSKWRFIPAKRGGRPMRIWAEVPIKFELK